MGIDLYRHCGSEGSYLLAAALTGVAFVCWKGGLWAARPQADGWRLGTHWGLAALLWLAALLAARGAWVALG
jgi:hypothetical protein